MRKQGDTARVLHLVVHLVLPLVLGAWYSMTDWTLLEAPIAVGTEHYARMLGDEVVHAATWNTLIYIAITIPLLTIVSIALAMLLSRPVRFIAFWRVAVFAPSVLPLVACSWRKSSSTSRALLMLLNDR